MAKLCPDGKLLRALNHWERDPDEGLPLLADLAHDYPKDPRVRGAAGLAFLDADAAWRALPHLEWAVRRDPEPEWLEALEEAYADLGMPLHAAQVARRQGGRPPEPLLEHLPGAPKSMSRKDQLELERGHVEISYLVRAGLDRIQAIAKKYPDYAEAANQLSLGYFLFSEFGKYDRAAQAAIARWPTDPLAVLHAVRAGLLTDGWEGAAKWAPNLRLAQDAQTPAQQLALIRAAAYMNDHELLDAALEHYYEVLEADDDIHFDAADAFEELLIAAEEDPAMPLLQLDEALVPYLAGASLTRNDAAEALSRYLRDAPGLVKVLPELIGYSGPQFVQLLTPLLLSEATPEPASGPWAQVLLDIARHGPGLRPARYSLMAELVMAGVAPADETLLHPSPPGDPDLRVRLQFHGAEIDLPAEDLLLLQESKRLSQEGDTAAADAIATELLGRYPGLLVLRTRVALGLLQADPEAAAQLLSVPSHAVTADWRDYALFLSARLLSAGSQGNTALAAQLLGALADLVGVNDQLWRAMVAEFPADDEDELGDAFEELPFPLDQSDSAPRLTPSELTHLKRLPETWQAALVPSNFIEDAAGTVRLAYLLVVAAPDGRVRSGTALTDPYSGERLFQEALKACLPLDDEFEEGLPQRLMVEDERVYAALALPFQQCGVQVQLGAVPDARRAVDSLRAALGFGSEEPLVAAAPADQAAQFLKAAADFFDAEPWRSYSAEQNIAFRLGDGDWRYANVMGQEGQEFGLSLFDSWAQLYGFLHEPHASPGDMSAPGSLVTAVENLGLSPLWLLAPEDAAYYLDNGAPEYDGLYPVLIRMTPDGAERPSLPLAAYTALLRLLVESLDPGGGAVPAIQDQLMTAHGPLQVRYPATGQEQGAKLLRAADRHNGTPLDDFAGLSPDTMWRLLYQPLETPELLQLPDVLGVQPSAPLLDLLGPLLEQLGKAPMKLTAKGNLPTAFVKERAADYTGDHDPFSASILRHAHNEDSFHDLHVARVVADLAGLVYKRHGKLHLTQAAAKLLDKHGLRGIYPVLLRTYVTKFNWSYWDGYDELPLVQRSWAFTCYLLMHFGAEPRAEEFYAQRFVTAFPALLSEVESTAYRTAAASVTNAYASRALRRFLGFLGLAEYEWGSVAKDYQRPATIKPTPLFADAIRLQDG